jgi:hypothetical protein
VRTNDLITLLIVSWLATMAFMVFSLSNLAR